MKKLFNYVLTIYSVLSIAFIIYIIIVQLNPKLSLSILAEKGPFTNGYALSTSFIFIWFLSFILIILGKLGKITSQTIVPIFCVGTISLLYLSFLREHTQFGDMSDYIAAAENILNSEPFYERYLYPPLWASFLAQIYKYLGLPIVMLTIFSMNQLSIIGFVILASLFLKRLGLSTNFSFIIVSLSMIVSVPILRNIVYSQVNLLLVDLILASILLFNKKKLFSALFLAFGIHLKVVPIFFVPIFLKLKNWKWLLSLAVTGIGIVCLTSYLDGSSYYFDFLNNLKIWAPSPLRSSSIQSFLINTNKFLGISLPSDILWNLSRLIMGGGLYFLSYLSIKQGSFFKDNADTLFSGIIPLFFLMIVISPTVWAHHLVILIIPSILILLHLKSLKELSAFSFGYFFTFIMPVFDIYPWSYLRLVGWLILLVLLSKVIISKRTYSDWVVVTDKELNIFIHKIISIMKS